MAYVAAILIPVIAAVILIPLRLDLYFNYRTRVNPFLRLNSGT